MAKIYPVLSRLDHDGVLYDPTVDTAKGVTIDLDDDQVGDLIDLGVLGESVGDAPADPAEDPGGKKSKA